MGIYGTVRPAVINPNTDIEIFYNYNPTRYTDDGDSKSFIALDPNYLQETECNNISIPGLYNLRLPLNIFNRKGFYSVYIRPKEIKATIVDVGSLASYSDVKGVVLHASDPALAGLTANNSLVGYRIEYLNTVNGQREDFSRLITSSSKCEGVTQVISSNAADVVRYRFSSFGGLIFCTVTPSLASSFKPNETPYIGVAGQQIVLINTKFNPVLLEIELTEHDDETISIMLEGEQIHDIDHGVLTTFNENREIYHQTDYRALKDALGNPAYTIKTKRTNVDTSQDITSILGDALSDNS